MFQTKRSIKKRSFSLSAKTQLILYIILGAILLIALRTWHLAVIEREEKLEEALKPQKRTVTEAAKRGTIRDRFNIPLAVNKMNYQATVVYNHIQQIPSVRWETLADGTRVKRLKRREYIRQLAEMLAQVLQMDADRLEDLIHSKAALYNQLPFLIKDHLTEKEYYKLKIKEKDWIGLHVKKSPCRYYPQGPIAADVIGYLGAINKQEYEKILKEIKRLEEFLKSWDSEEEYDLLDEYSSIEDIQSHLLDLKEKAYKINDYIGKTGIESEYEYILRGFQGQKSYITDARGNFTQELAEGRPTLSGQRILLSISAELQAFAEELLISQDQARQARVSKGGSIEKSVVSEKQPWIKGGAIIAMEPYTGEILALASYPRYNPNDFVAHGHARKNILKWFETESFLEQIWEKRIPLERERYDPITQGIYVEQLWLNRNNYLNFVLPLKGPLREFMNSIHTIKEAVHIQKNSDTYQFENLATSYEKTLILDLCQLEVYAEAFDEETLETCGHFTLDEHRDHCCAFAQIKDSLKQTCRDLYHQKSFLPWRRLHEKEFLKQKREEEKKLKQYSKPYIDLLDKEERLHFEHFWQEHGKNILAAFLIGDWGAIDPEDKSLEYLEYFRQLGTDFSPIVECQQALKKALGQLPPPIAYSYLGTLRSFRDLNRPLFGKYRRLRQEKGVQFEKHLAMGFYPVYGYGYGRSSAYRQATTQGSIFKLVTGYAGLMHCYQNNPNGDLNPLIIHDNWHKQGSQMIVGYKDDGTPIPQLYKGGRIPKSLSRHLGQLDMIKALACSSNPYFSLIAGEVLDSPETLLEAARLFSYGSTTGLDLPGEISGHLPDDVKTNRTGLYALAIGQHSLVVTPVQAAVMLSAIANGGKVLQPKIVRMLAGKRPTFSTPHCFTPLASIRRPKAVLEALPTIVKREIPMPNKVREVLIEGMRQGMNKAKQSLNKSLKNLYSTYPPALRDNESVQNQFVAKTSTAEVVDPLDLENSPHPKIFNHLWLGGILLNAKENTYLYRNENNEAELVVVVYLKYGGYGKDSIPIATQIGQKWLQIKKKYEGKM